MSLADVLQLIGAALILSAFLLAQFRRLGTDSYVYLALNVAGAGILAELAAAGHQWGFLLLEFVWALASAGALIRKLARDAARRPFSLISRRPGGPPHAQ
ncbi:MAG TPA: hypothetical protein VH637_14520 [Streptosporangiaceae bacterium]|jgi:hypothetical protein